MQDNDVTFERVCHRDTKQVQNNNLEYTDMQ